jgi:magnesium transporter
MLTVYRRSERGLVAADDPAAALKDGSAVWVDMLRPSEAEEKLVEDAYGVDVPTETERAMLEFSARFYQEDGALVLTATLVTLANEKPKSDGVSFILTKTNTLITVRAIEPTAFRVGQGRASARIDNAADGGDVLMALLEAVIERLADVLAEVSTRAQRLSEDVFNKHHFGAADMRPALAELSTLGVIVTLGRDSLGSLERLFAFAGKRCDAHGLPADQMAALLRDAEQLDRQGDAMQDHLVFLLDGVLGLVAANQNVAIQRLSMFASVFVPSTLIASIFGMNFKFMNWFDAPWGPWVAFLLMFLASGGALATARWRHWI